VRRGARWLLPAAAAVACAVFAASTKADSATATPIQHLVVIFQENVSFDHYFGTYPKAANTDGRPFAAAPGTPSVNGLSGALLTANPNLSNPQRLDSSADGPGGNGNGQLTCDQDHNYSDEQRAFDGGKMDKFVQSVGTDGGTKVPAGTVLCDPKTVMDYYDGNTVTAFWNYAQHFAMSDNSYSPTFGPSSPGAINLVSGTTGAVDTAHEVNNPSIATAAKPNADLTADGHGGFSLTSDAQPYWDDCSTRDAVALTGKNIGDELNAARLSWGWFQRGNRPTTTFAVASAATGHAGQATSTFIPNEFSGSFTGKVVPPHASNQALCDAVHPVGAAFGGNGQWGFKDDYIPHHEPFDYYASTANPHHLAPTSLSAIGTDTQTYVAGVPQFDTANHQYDISDFDQLVSAITAGTLPPTALPAVSFLKAPGYQDGHAAYSDPADEQQFVAEEIDALMKTPDWSSTAVVIAYDDSDGWYDHQYPGVQNPSNTVADAACGPSPQTTAPLAGQQGRCGFGPRQPFLVVSPWAKLNTVDHNLSDLASVPNFIEYNWHLPAIAGSFDQALASIDAGEHVPFDIAGLFDFSRQQANIGVPLLLNPSTGRIDLADANEQGVNLAGVNLAGADMTGASFQGVNLRNAFLANVDMRGAGLRGTNLQGADLSGANLAGATLQGANTNKVTWSNTTCPDGTNSDADGGSCERHF
jgi:phospholipase C